MEIIGKAPINPGLFYSGKIAGYVVWIALLIELCGIPDLSGLRRHEQLALIVACISLILIAVSLANLGSATRLGLPADSTRLKTSGLYRFSRNPMYLGFNLLSLSAIVFIGSSILAALGIYSIVTYHLIIRAEEQFLETRFGDKYRAYRNKVRRYL